MRAFQLILCWCIVAVSIAGICSGSWHTRVAYVVRNITSFECIPLPENDLCPDDIMIPRSFLGTLYYVFRQIRDMADQAGQSFCLGAVKRSRCLGIPRCAPLKVTVDMKTATAACTQEKGLCPVWLEEHIFRCSQNLSTYQKQNQNFTRITCKKVRDINGTCPDTRYKLPQFPHINYQSRFNNLALTLRSLKSNLTMECYDELKKTGCEVYGKQVCTDDGEDVVSFITKQDCVESLQCVKEQTNHDIGAILCGALPDVHTAKKVYVPVNGLPAFNQSISAMFISFFTTITSLFVLLSY